VSILHLDIETYSEVDLKSVGLYKYAAHPTTEILVGCFALDDNPVHIWLPNASEDEANLLRPHFPDRFIYTGQWPRNLVTFLDQPGCYLSAHNAQFERVVLSGPLGATAGFKAIDPRKCRCTASKAAIAGIPRNLGDAAAALGTHPKDETGRINMLGMARPRSGAVKRYTITDDTDRWVRLINYCIDDVEAERDLDNRLPDLSDSETQVYWLDQIINDRGIGVDLEAIANVQTLISEYKAVLEKECRLLTGLQPTQTAKLADWIRANGYPALKDLQAASVVRALGDPACAGGARRALEIRTIHAMKAVAKYDSMVEAAHEGRLRGMMMYHGAGTGRWSSLLVQLQNLYRPAIKDCDSAIESFAARDLDWVRDLWPVEPMKVFASCVRGMLVPADGKDLLALDYAGIENRIIAWAYDEHWKLPAFRAFDNGVGPDLYKLAYANAFAVKPDTVNDFQRQIGKVMELALGYEGGASAFLTMADTYRINIVDLVNAAMPVIPDDVLYEAEKAYEWALEQSRATGMARETFLVCDSLKRLWRRSHPAIVRGWKDLVDAAVKALRQPGKGFAIPNKRVAFKKHDEWLYMKLPSGRTLAYYKPEIVEDERRPTFTYMGIDTNTRRWMRVPTYGGRLTENMVQATARDILVNGMFHLENAGYPLVLTVHDEAVCEIDEGFGSVEDAVAIACLQPAWTGGLPLAAAGYRGKRYRK